MNASEQSTDTSSGDGPSSFQSDDYAKMVLVPVLLIMGVGYLFFGPESLFENAALGGVLLFFVVLLGSQLYQKWKTIS